MCARLDLTIPGPCSGQTGRGILIQVSGEATQRALCSRPGPTIDQAIDFPVGMPQRRHLILQAMVKGLSKVTGAPLGVGNGPISIFPSYELGTRLKELIEIYGPLHRLSGIGDG